MGFYFLEKELHFEAKSKELIGSPKNLMLNKVDTSMSV
jgi:hypothetical protein